MTGGTANRQGAYHFEVSTRGVDLAVSNGVMQVAQLQLQDPDTSETVFALPAMTVNQARFNFRERDLRLGRVQINAAAVRSRLNPDGTPNLALERVAASLEDRQAQVGLVRTCGGALVARRGKDGGLNLLAWIKSTGTNAPSVNLSLQATNLPATSPATGWREPGASVPELTGWRTLGRVVTATGFTAA